MKRWIPGIAILVLLELGDVLSTYLDISHHGMEAMPTTSRLLAAGVGAIILVKIIAPPVIIGLALWLISLGHDPAWRGRCYKGLEIGLVFSIGMLFAVDLSNLSLLHLLLQYH